jgi:hypothetical protein
MHSLYIELTNILLYYISHTKTKSVFQSTDFFFLKQYYYFMKHVLEERESATMMGWGLSMNRIHLNQQILI